MVKVLDLQRDRRKIEVPISVGTNDDGENITEPLELTYRPSAYTANMEKKVNEQFAGDWKALGGLTWVHDLVVEWDLEGLTDPETNQPTIWPLWIEHPDNLKADGTTKTGQEGYDEHLPALASLPSGFIGEVISGVSKDMGGRQAPSNAS